LLLGGSLTDAWQLAGISAGRVLNGEKPSNLPGQQSTKLELKSSEGGQDPGITFPLPLLAHADEAVE
jgi:putative tryptophan/tyrosine transport system substrate-binding protein